MCCCCVLQHDYKAFAPGVTAENVDWGSAPALQESPVTSAICQPVNGTQIEEGTDEIPGNHTLLSAQSLCRQASSSTPSFRHDSNLPGNEHNSVSVHHEKKQLALYQPAPIDNCFPAVASALGVIETKNSSSISCNAVAVVPDMQCL